MPLLASFDTYRLYGRSRPLEPAAEPWPVIHSRELRELTEQTRANKPR